MARFETVSFLSDYGLADEFVGVVKSVVRSLAPHARVIDISHEVPAHDVRAGSLTLVRSVQYLAPGVVLAVVDPEVGTERRAIAVEVGEGEAVFVGPDNGLLAPAVSMVGGANRAVELTSAAHHLPAPSVTFAGRDVFAPVTAHLCNGSDLFELGDPIDPFSLRPGLVPLSRVEDGRLYAQVLWVDRFGNVQLNAGAEDIDAYGDRVSVQTRGQVRTGRRVATYAEARPGELGVVIDSYGLVSLALDRAPAAEELGLNPGDEVVLAPPS